MSGSAEFRGARRNLIWSKFLGARARRATNGDFVSRAGPSNIEDVMTAFIPTNPFFPSRLAGSCLLSLMLLTLIPAARSQQGSLSGTVVDPSGASVAHAQVRLSLAGRAPDRETQSADSGEFGFSNVPAGAYRLTFSANGFATRIITGELLAAQTLALPQTTLAIDRLVTEVSVTQTQVEIAQQQLKVEEQQRLAGVLPNFFVSYDRDAVPLNTGQKLQLSAKTWLDPSSFVVNGIIAGVWQAENTHKGFGQGAQGYGKRYGAAFADFGTALMFDKVVMASAFKQDPRYFYKGTGTNRERALYAMSQTFVCRGDNKKEQFCYSSLIDRFGIGFVTKYYYPAADRDSNGVILRDAGVGLAVDAAFNLFQEFVAREITRKKPW